MALVRWMLTDGRSTSPASSAVAALVTAIDAVGAGGSLDGVSMRRLLEPLRMVDVAVPERATMDVDTWADARAVGATEGGGR